MKRSSLTKLLMLFAFSVVAAAEEINDCVKFDKATYDGINGAFHNVSIGGRVNSDLPSYPIGVKAVLSVALKLQALEDRNGASRNFLVSPLAIAGALGELMLGADGELRKQIGVLLTLDENENSTPFDAPTIVEPAPEGAQKVVPDARSADPDNGRPMVMPDLFSRINVQEAGGYEPQVKMQFQPSSVLRDDGTLSFEFHRQLGGLIGYLSSPLKKPEDIQSMHNRSYLHSSSAFFVDKRLNLKETFTRAVIDYYNAILMTVDFRESSINAQKTINEWGSTETGGLIPKFLSLPPKAGTAVIQAVAVHFRGAWLTPFIPEATIPGEFKITENSSVPVSYMRGSLEEALYAESSRLGVRILTMPYSGNECAMHVMLPMDSNPHKYNVQKLMSKLTEKDIQELQAAAKPRTVNVIFPKLSLTSSLSIGAALKEHAEYMKKEKEEKLTSTSRIQNTATDSSNISTAPSKNRTKRSQCRSSRPPIFTVVGTRSGGTDDSGPSENQGNADSTVTLTGAATDSSFRVSDIIQQIALEINEAGTEAAAIAGSSINYSGDVVNFKIKSPFLFFIREERMKAVLFWGNVVNPNA